MAKKDAVVLESGEKIESIGPWTIAWRKFKQNRVAMAGLMFSALLMLLGNLLSDICYTLVDPRIKVDE